MELEPGESVINDHLGDAYWRAGRKTEARFQWNKALSYASDTKETALIRHKLERGLDPFVPMATLEPAKAKTTTVR